MTTKQMRPGKAYRVEAEGLIFCGKFTGRIPPKENGTVRDRMTKLVIMSDCLVSYVPEEKVTEVHPA